MTPSTMSSQKFRCQSHEYRPPLLLGPPLLSGSQIYPLCTILTAPRRFVITLRELHASIVCVAGANRHCARVPPAQLPGRRQWSLHRVAHFESSACCPLTRIRKAHLIMRYSSLYFGILSWPGSRLLMFLLFRPHTEDCLSMERCVVAQRQRCRGTVNRLGIGKRLSFEPLNSKHPGQAIAQ